MPTFPTLASGAVVKYPLTRVHKFRTLVYTSVDMSEQRAAQGVALDDFTLTFPSLKKTDMILVRDFFNARKGSTDTTWTLVLPEDPPVTYQHLQFVPGQQFEAVEFKPGRFKFSLKVRQTRPTDTP